MAHDNLQNAGISMQARAFLAAARLPPHEPITSESIVATRQELSAAYRSGSEEAVREHNIAIDYEEIAGIRCLIATPQTLGTGMVLLYFYGGGYVTGSPFEDLRIIAPLSSALGVSIVAPAYRLAPEHPFPAANDDAVAVYQALLDRQGASRLLLAGESAGGNLALTLMNRAAMAALELPAAVALLSPWCDLTHTGDSVYANDERDPTLARSFVEDAAFHYAAGADRGTPSISPLFADYDRPLPPTIITSGTRDLLLSQCVRLTDRLREAGTHVELDVREGMWHVYEFYPELPEARQSITRISDFLTREALRSG